MKRIQDEIKRRRKERHLSQEETAKLSGVSLNVVRALENGKATVQIDNLRKVLTLFGLELDIREK